MFYRKTETEILCDTLIKLSDKQEAFIEKFGTNIKSPYHDPMHSIMVRLETRLDLPSASGMKSIDIVKNKPVITTEPKKRYFTSKATKLKPAKTVSEDLKVSTNLHTAMPPKATEWDTASPTIENIMKMPARMPVVRLETVEENTPFPTPAPEIKQPVTTDNIDQLASQVMDTVEPAPQNPQVVQ